MTKDEWLSLRVGDIVCNKNNRNHRVVTDVFSNGNIKLPKVNKDKRMTYSIYCCGDKNNFLKTKFRLRLKK